MNIQLHPGLSAQGLTDEASLAYFWSCFHQVMGSAVDQINRNISFSQCVKSQRLFSQKTRLRYALPGHDFFVKTKVLRFLNAMHRRS
jgi:hypothetical protein